MDKVRPHGFMVGHYLDYITLMFFRFQVLDECHKAERWLHERTTEQESLPKDANPELQSGEIRRKADALNA